LIATGKISDRSDLKKNKEKKRRRRKRKNEDFKSLVVCSVYYHTTISIVLITRNV